MSELNPRSATKPQTSTPDRKPRFPRDLLMVLIGAAIAVPVTLLGNYLSSNLFPQTVIVSPSQIGVQQLNAPQKYFSFSKSNAARLRHEGTIDVIYGMGVDTKRYRCTVKVSDARLFAKVEFDQTCRQISFKFINTALLFEVTSEINDVITIVFSIEVISDSGQSWSGSQGIDLFVY